MKRTILQYSLAIAAAAFALQWLEYKYTVRLFSTEIYVVIIALLFMLLGIWVGIRLTSQKAGAPFEKNTRALASLGISEREYQVLELLAGGGSNREIAEQLNVSGNTVKTHIASLYRKLEVSRRTQAVRTARDLGLIA